MVGTGPENQGFDHGPRLSGEEYDRKIVELQEGLPPAPSRKQERWVRRQQLELAIDHRLGRQFPADRREALWAIQEQVEKKRFRLVFKYLLRKLFGKGIYRDAQGIANFLVEEYAKELNQTELESFFGKEEARNPTLPVDIDQLGK